MHKSLCIDVLRNHLSLQRQYFIDLNNKVRSNGSQSQLIPLFTKLTLVCFKRSLLVTFSVKRQ